MGAYLEELRKELRFTASETSQLLTAGLILTFIFAFNDKQPTFNPAYWFGNFLLFLFVVLVSLLFRIVVQKAVAIKSGFHAEFKIWSYGLAMGLALAVISNGRLIILLPGGIAVAHLAAHRLGHFRYGLNMGTWGWIASMGSVANILLGMFLKQLMNMFNFSSGLFERFIYVNFLLALFMYLPLPPLDGATAFFGSRLNYVIIFGFIFGYVTLFLSQFYSLIFAAIIGVAVWLVYYIVMEM